MRFGLMLNMHSTQPSEKCSVTKGKRECVQVASRPIRDVQLGGTRTCTHEIARASFVFVKLEKVVDTHRRYVRALMT